MGSDLISTQEGASNSRPLSVTYGHAAPQHFKRIAHFAVKLSFSSGPLVGHVSRTGRVLLFFLSGTLIMIHERSTWRNLHITCHHSLTSLETIVLVAASKLL